jgi:hypothetical protein
VQRDTVGIRANQLVNLITHAAAPARRQQFLLLIDLYRALGGGRTGQP